MSDRDTNSSPTWKAKYDRQTLLVESIMSLLNKYGRSLDLDKLYREFLLTLMGQMLVGRSYYFHFDDESKCYVVVAHYGEGKAGGLPVFPPDSPLIRHLQSVKSPCRTAELPATVTAADGVKQLTSVTSLIAPIHLRENLIGLICLGPRITGQHFTDSDTDIIGTLCAVSAVSFSNARLFENARVSMREVQRLHDLRTEMISRVTHEFRTPLTVISGGLQVLDVSEDSAPIRDSVAAAVSDLERLIGSLLELRGDEASPRVDKCFNPSRITSELVATIQEVSRKSIVFSIADYVQKDVMVRNVGREAFVKVAVALIDNAIKFSGDHSRILLGLAISEGEPNPERDGTRVLDWETQTQRTLEAYQVFPGVSGQQGAAQSPVVATVEAESQSYLVFRVEDAGIGIPADELRFLGEPFRQASNSPDQRIKGKALGLAVVLKTVTECGGQLWCCSREGFGTTFSVFFPLS